MAADICSTLADYSGNSCIAGTGLTCKYSCTDIHNVMYYYDCVSRNCVWLGGTSCDEA